MKKYIKYILIVIALVVVFSPAVYAQTTTPPTGSCTYKKDGQMVTEPTGWTQVACTQSNGTWMGPYVLLAPLPCATPGSNGCDSNGKLTTYDPSSGTNQIGTYLNVMIRIFIGLCAVLAVVMIVIGGIEYMTSELPGTKEHGKERIQGAIFGLVLALGAWTLLYQINPDILNTDLKSLTTQTVSVDLQNDIPQTPTIVNGKAMYGKYADGTNWQSVAGATAVLPAGVTVNKMQCTTVGQQNCTSTAGLDPNIINLMASDCAKVNGTTCPITITAGTEYWLHGGTSGNTSHQIGSSSMDIKATPAMNLYISGNNSVFPKDGSVYTEAGVCYYAESAGSTSSTTANHWHVYKC
jgi:type IV secretory pathway VirB2 component (pilin)